MRTVGAHGGRMGPPTCGTTPVTMGQTCMSVMRAAGGMDSCQSLRSKSKLPHRSSVGLRWRRDSSSRRNIRDAKTRFARNDGSASAVLHFPALAAVVSFVGLLRVLRAGAAAGPGGAAAVDEDQRAGDGNAGGTDIDEAPRGFDGELEAGFDDNVHPGLQVNFHAGLVSEILAGLLLQVLADLQGHGLADFFVAIAGGFGVEIAFDFFFLVVFHDEAAVVADEFAGIVFDAVVHVFFGVDEDLLAALFVLEAELVVVGGAAALGAAGHEGGTRLMVREGVCRHLVVVVDAAGDDGPVRIAFEEINNDFLSDARDGDRAPVLAGPRLRDAHPTRAVLILLTEAVPEKLHLHAAVLIGINLLARGPDHDRCLDTLYDGFGSQALRAERHGKGDAREMVGVSLLGTAT